MMATAHNHGGIPCSVHVSSVCCTIDAVLRAIEDRYTSDLHRLRSRVSDFGMLTSEEQADGTLGEFRTEKSIADPDDIYNPSAPWEGSVDERRVGRILLSEDADIAVVAHELGHAASTKADHDARQALEDEWASEMAADYYAHKWGFGDEIERTRPDRSLPHHGPGPGETVTMSINGREVQYRVDEQFVFRRIIEETAGCDERRHAEEG